VNQEREIKMAISRRTLLTSAAATAIAATILPSHQTVRAQASGIVRRDINALAPDHSMVKHYRDAVGLMRTLPASNPLSWQHQAKIHERFCPHGNWYFLPWHRAYLHQFENIIRKLSGARDFALPYWDWTRNPQIPAAFWGNGNPLNHPRDASRTTNVPAEFVGESVIRGIMETTDFEDFASYKSSAPINGSGGGSSTLESAPHNQVHVTVGLDMQSYLSPRDPIFWLHHCNIDRIWASWNAARNANSNDPGLADFVFSATQLDRTGTVRTSQFLDSDGNAKSYKVRDMNTINAMGYEYDRLENPPQTGFPAIARNLSRRNLSRNTVRNELKRTASAGTAISTNLVVEQKRIDAIAEAGRAKQIFRIQNASALTIPKIVTASLKVQGLRAPKNPLTTIRVFLNCAYLSLKTPINDPHYVASAAFFLADGHKNHDRRHGATYVFDLTDTIDALRRSGRDVRGNLQPQIIAVNPDGTGAELKIDGKFEINIETLG
jgi:tyrosinase